MSYNRQPLLDYLEINKLGSLEQIIDLLNVGREHMPIKFLPGKETTFELDCIAEHLQLDSIALWNSEIKPMHPQRLLELQIAKAAGIDAWVTTDFSIINVAEYLDKAKNKGRDILVVLHVKCEE